MLLLNNNVLWKLTKLRELIEANSLTFKFTTRMKKLNRDKDSTGSDGKRVDVSTKSEPTFQL